MEQEPRSFRFFVLLTTDIHRNDRCTKRRDRRFFSRRFPTCVFLIFFTAESRNVQFRVNRGYPPSFSQEDQEDHRRGPPAAHFSRLGLIETGDLPK